MFDNLKYRLGLSVLLTGILLFFGLLCTDVSASPIETEKFDIHMNWIQNGITYKELNITLVNKQDEKTDLSLKTIIDNIDFPVSGLSDVEFSERKQIKYNETVCNFCVREFCWDENTTNETFCDNRFITDCGFCGSYKEEKTRWDFIKKNLFQKTEDREKGEIAHKWDQVTLTKSGTPYSTKTFKLAFDAPIVKRGYEWGSQGIVWLEIPGVGVFADFSNSSWWNQSWPKCRNITIDSGDVDSDLTDFPFLFKTDNTVLNTSNTQANGEDIRFVNTSCGNGGSELKHEIEEWNAPSAGAKYVWVKGDFINSTSNTIFAIYYNNSVASDGQDAPNVWDSNYLAVYHMNDDQPTAKMVDSKNQVNATEGAAPIYSALGQIGYGIEFVPDDYFTTDSAVYATNPSQYTFEVWLEPDEINSDDGIFGSPTTTKPSWFLVANLVAGFVSIGGSDVGSLSPATQDAWHYYAESYNTSHTVAYKNGTEQDADAASGTAVLNISFAIGRYSTNLGYDGIMDELRFSNISRNVTWQKASYESGRDDFITIGTEEAAPIINEAPTLGSIAEAPADPATYAPSASYQFNITVNDGDGRDNIRSLILDWNGTNETHGYTAQPGQQVLNLHFDEGSGTTAYDVSGEGNDGTITNPVAGTVTYTSGGKYGYGMHFNHTKDDDGRVILPNTSVISNTTSSASVWAWVNEDVIDTVSPSNRAIINDDVLFLYMNRNTNKYYCYYYNESGSSEGVNKDESTLTGEWHHWGCDFNGSYIRLWKDGDIVSTSATNYSGQGLNNGTLFYIGGDGAGRMFNGTIDEVQVYNKVLSQSEVTSLYTDGFRNINTTAREFWLNKTDLAGGIYNYTWYVNDYVGDSDSLTDSYTINKVSTSITLYLNGTAWTVDEARPYPYPTNINATINVSSMQASVVLEKNSTPVGNPEEVSNALGVYNYTGSFAGNTNYSSSSNQRYLTLAPPPQWGNQGQSDNNPFCLDSNTLYSQFQSSIGLSHAWLSTNETGNWKNYTETVVTKIIVNSDLENYYYNETFSTDPSAHWNVSAGTWVRNSTDSTYQATATDSRAHINLTNVSNLTGAYVDVSMMSSLDSSSAGVGFSFGYQDKDNFYTIWISPYDDKMYFFKAVNYSFTEIASCSRTISKNVWYDFGLYWNNANITVWFDSETTPCLTTTDSTYTSGGFGVYVGGSGAGSKIDDFKIAPPLRNQTSPTTWTWTNFTWSNSTVATNQSVGWRIYANDTYGYENTTDIQTFDIFPYEFQSQSANINVIESDNETYSLTVYACNGVNRISGELVWNGTSYTNTTETAVGNQTLTKTITIPQISPDSENFTWYWNYYINYTMPDQSLSVNKTNTTDVNVTVYRLMITDCTTGIEALRFWFYNENNVSELVDNTTLEIAIYMTRQFDLYRNYSFRFDNNYTYPICIYPNWATAYVNATLQYRLPAHVVRNYWLVNASISNATQNITLYNLDAASATLFQFEILDQSGDQVVDAIVKIQRYYVATDSYITITEMRTDVRGKAPADLVRYEVYYKFIIELDNVVLDTIPPMLLTDTTYQFIVGDTPMGEIFTYIGEVATSCTFNETTHVLRCTVVDTSGTMSQACMNVNYIGCVADEVIHSSCVYSSGADIVFDLDDWGNVTGKQFTYSFVIYYTSSPTNTYLAESGWLDFAAEALYEASGVLMALVMLLVLSSVGVWNPSVSVMLGSASFFISYALGLIAVSLGSIVGLTVVAAIIIWRMRT